MQPQQMNYVPDYSESLTVQILNRGSCRRGINAAVLGRLVRLLFAIHVRPDDKISNLCRQAFPLVPKVHKRAEGYPFQRVSAVQLP